jgi:hypothetical protein
MATIVTRTGKGSALTFAEGDANFTNLNDDKIELDDISVTQETASGLGALSYNNATGVLTYTPPVLPSAGIDEVSDDTTPVLGGNLDCAGFEVSDLELKEYTETIHALGSTDTPTVDPANGNVQTVTITSGLTLPAFTGATAGQSVTLIATGSGTASGTAAYKFAGGNTTLTTLSVVSIFYDGTNYLASIATDFQ